MSCSTTTTDACLSSASSSSAVRLGLGVGHAGDRLVDQQQLRVLHQQHADLEPLLLAVARAARASMCCCGRQADDRRAPRRCGRARRLVGAASSSVGPAARCRPAPARGSRSTVWCSNTVGFWNLRPMPSLAISASSSLVRSTRAVEARPRPVGPRLAGDDVHHRRLAGAVGADDRAQLAGLDEQRQVVQRLEAVEADGDAVEIEQLPSGCVRAWRASSRLAPARRRPLALRLARAAGASCGHRPTMPLRQEQRHDDEQRAEREQPDLGKRAGEPGLGAVDEHRADDRRRPACRGRRPRPRSPISIELAGANSLGLMMPTCGT